MSWAAGEDCPLRHNSSTTAFLVGAHVTEGQSLLCVASTGTFLTKYNWNLSWVWVQEWTSMWKVNGPPDRPPSTISSSSSTWRCGFLSHLAMPYFRICPSSSPQQLCKHSPLATRLRSGKNIPSNSSTERDGHHAFQYLTTKDPGETLAKRITSATNRGLDVIEEAWTRDSDLNYLSSLIVNL